MKFVIKLFPEITIKSKPVRQRQVRQLRDNIRKLLKPVDEQLKVSGQWDKIEVDIPNELADLGPTVAEMLQRIPGIANIIEVQEHSFKTFDDILEKAIPLYSPVLEGKTFVVRVKRAGKHDFTSVDLERYIGGGLRKLTQAKNVDLHHPEVIVKLEVRDDKVYLIERRYEGLGGFPLGSQDAVLSLISGGFDSTVSSYLTMKRGLKTHFCFFNLGGAAHEIGVKQVSQHIWQRYGASHRVRFVTVPFEDVVGEILKKVHHSQMGVVLKRMMLRAAEKVAAELGVHALVTGEAVAQVSSQTLANLDVISRASDMLLLRPLITMDKQDIIRLARQIGTEGYAANMPEYCGVISDRPTTRARLDRIEAQEANFDFAVLDQAVANKQVENIDQVLDSVVAMGDVALVNVPSVDDVIVDIRAPDEQERKPLHLTNNLIEHIPFYELLSRRNDFDPGKRYLFYCDKGTMSQMHAGHFKSLGFENIGVYKAS
ncbi:MAG: tRNA 4-thiouridine(8) synthase ThiI [Hahellaceae bacterium]|nr:tRNA 4-thiouridine(8) synthase ThiI [Hahellaceae bacterium]MCP5169184.1 tRNA 4-thiouridine(8) synthase ThiI [Hahellaceae bacterium]